MTRVIHTGDTHLGYQQYHRAERRTDFLAAFQQVAEDATRETLDAVVHAGDLFHDRRPTLADVMGTLSVLRTLDDADVPFLAIVGNHESKRDAQWLDLFESLGLATRLGPDPVVIGDVAFYGLDFVPRARRDDLGYDFEPHDAEYAALVTHGLFEPFPHGDWDARELLSEATVDFDAVLLGDDHTPQTRNLEEYGTWLTYCGSTERASADERDERGYNIVAFEDGVDIRRRGLDTREFVYVDVELASGEGIERIRERIGQYDVEDAVVIVKISGDGEAITPAAVEEFADEQGALVARVTDEREVADEQEVDVNFADPDEAVRERIRDLGLSRAARDLDETIRASKVADSNVADEIESRVTEIVEEADAGAFTPADDQSPNQADRAEDEASESGGETEAEADEAAGEQHESAEKSSQNDDSAGADDEQDRSDESDEEQDDSAEAGDGQVTMEDYL